MHSACLCAYPEQKHPHCAKNECYVALATDFGQDLSKNCHRMLSRDFTSGSVPDCKNKLEALVQQSKWLAPMTHASRSCRNSAQLMQSACRCALPNVRYRGSRAIADTNIALRSTSVHTQEAYPHDLQKLFLKTQLWKWDNFYIFKTVKADSFSLAYAANVPNSQNYRKRDAENHHRYIPAKLDINVLNTRSVHQLSRTLPQAHDEG
ncbi:hypothetical protein CDD83_13 [Cordyceps sp. RAO-2017]|nr:hypothetical protein CDD83_13 [Cordyceps sp. RAO-2017]